MQRSNSFRIMKAESDYFTSIINKGEIRMEL